MDGDDLSDSWVYLPETSRQSPDQSDPTESVEQSMIDDEQRALDAQNSEEQRVFDTQNAEEQRDLDTQNAEEHRDLDTLNSEEQRALDTQSSEEQRALDTQNSEEQPLSDRVQDMIAPNASLEPNYEDLSRDAQIQVGSLQNNVANPPNVYAPQAQRLMSPRYQNSMGVWIPRHPIFGGFNNGRFFGYGNIPQMHYGAYSPVITPHLPLGFGAGQQLHPPHYQPPVPLSMTYLNSQFPMLPADHMSLTNTMNSSSFTLGSIPGHLPYDSFSREWGESSNGTRLSAATSHPPIGYKDAKFFVIKSYDKENVQASIKYGVWTSSANGNLKLNSAYHEAKEKEDPSPVFLFFSVNSSKKFCGVAEMMGPVDFENSVNCWRSKWRGHFPVIWHFIKDVPNYHLDHIILENNNYKPVTHSRDAQEVKLEQGLEILSIFAMHNADTSILDDFELFEARRQHSVRMNQVYQSFSRATRLEESNTTSSPSNRSLLRVASATTPETEDAKDSDVS